VQSLLKALGITIWGLIAFGLLAVFIFVGYEAALRYRRSIGAAETAAELSNQVSWAQRNPSVAPLDSAGHTIDLSAAPAHNSADPGDPLSVAQSHFAPSDCANAVERPRAAFDATRRARIDRLLSTTEAAKAESGWPLVKMGELYFGAGEYELAIAAIERGLSKGEIPHLDEAYVYLGRSEKAIGDIDEARNAFAKLKDVPDINPKVLRLWTLYAESQLGAASQASADSAECANLTHQP
jgi:tetratricopeptide (TPR) repeat protein